MVFPRQDENVGSLTLVEPRVGWQRGPRVVIYEVSKTLYTPTRQRAGLAPRNPVLALTHRYLSHDHFRPICAQRGLCTRTYTHRQPTAASPLDVSAFTIYSAPRVGDAVGYLVDIVYLGLCSRPRFAP